MSRAIGLKQHFITNCGLLTLQQPEILLKGPNSRAEFLYFILKTKTMLRISLVVLVKLPFTYNSVPPDVVLLIFFNLQYHPLAIYVISQLAT